MPMEQFIDSQLRQEVFKRYKKIHGDYVNGDISSFPKWLAFFEDLYQWNYAKYINNKNAKILEIGCAKGFFLKVLEQEGFIDLTGIDLSPEDISIAREFLGIRGAIVADAANYLNEHPETFDIIFAKDILEHIPRQEIGKFLLDINRALLPGGLSIFQVPNMDWLMSSHERYMDWTHEGGFTKESLGQLCRIVFKEVEVKKVKYLFPKTFRERLFINIIRKCYVVLFSIHLKILGEGAETTWFDVREIVSICKK